MKKNKFYVVTAYRWGNRSDHSYFVGLFDKKHAAITAAEKEENWRGGKYNCQIIETDIFPSWRNTDESELKVIYNKGI